MNWTFGRKLALGFAIAILTILLIGVSGHRANSDLIESDRWVTHTEEVRSTLAQIMSGMKDAETGQRGYLLTGDERFLEPYHAALGEVEKDLASARRLTADNPQQQQRLATLAPMIAERLRVMAEVIEVRRRDGLEAVVKSNRLFEGKVHMDSVRQKVAELDQAENVLLVERRHRSEASAAAAQATILWGGLFGTLVVLLAGVVISRFLST